ncbi:hypothetical protein H0O00_05315 [Candidatus Micrarchaeota archaeon]|nr:hypothetical protein [Candidatus Micrarchaeota archaeon]
MKAQASLEFMIVYSVLLMIFVVVFTISFGGSLNLFQAQDSALAMRNSHAAAAAMNYVYLAGDGASYNFTRANADNRENVTMSAYAVTVWRPLASAAVPLLDGKMNASSLNRSGMLITNNGGEIDIGD